MAVWIKSNTSSMMIVICFIGYIDSMNGQCGLFINSFPYNEGFETSNGGWFAGGFGSDWKWGSPSRLTISGAGNGSKCRIIGSLSDSSYTNSEASWLQGPCFDFTLLQYPYITFKVFREMEQRFNRVNLQYSLDDGSSWTDLGASNESPTCLNAYWYNYSPVTYLASLSSSPNGWSGNIQSTSRSCQGGNGWVDAKHIMPSLAGKINQLLAFHLWSLGSKGFLFYKPSSEMGWQNKWPSVR